MSGNIERGVMIITYNPSKNNESLLEQLRRIFRHQEYKVVMHHLIMVMEEKEWIPHSTYSSSNVAEFQLKRVKRQYARAMIVPVEYYVIDEKL